MHKRALPDSTRRLTEAQIEQLSALLAGVAEAHGFFGEAWTTRRVAVVIRQAFYFRYHRLDAAREASLGTRTESAQPSSHFAAPHADMGCTHE